LGGAAPEQAVKRHHWVLLAGYVVLVVTLWTLVIITEAWNGL
jgi:hypothetical protein